MKEELERELGIGAALCPPSRQGEGARGEAIARSSTGAQGGQAQKKAAEKKRREAAALKSQQRQQGGAATVAAKASDRGKGETTRGGSDRWPGYPLHELRGSTATARGAAAVCRAQRARTSRPADTT